MVYFSPLVLDSSLFIIEAATGVIRLAPGGIDLEAENRNAFNINVQATDNPGGTTRLSVCSKLHVCVCVCVCVYVHVHVHVHVRVYKLSTR